MTDDTDAPVYRQRPKPFGFEVTYRLDPAHLFVDTGRKQERIPYARIVACRLSYRPANVTSQGYRADLRIEDGRALRLGNLSWKTYFEADRQDDAYRAFITELLARVAAANPKLACVAGRPFWIWALGALAGAAMVAALAVAFAVALANAAWPLAGLTALFLVPLAGQAWAMARRNRPTPFAPPSIPPLVLPKPGRSG
ncbi:hypothetical protein NK718_02115 [Alsobacter sp. SYSU M60028]|uniref:DUF2207 domain-containing protein n=1 Tax=Alsobacter ponti TaxID=2962936 RepID=A0ABT1L8P3_9HYPH|nr:hypothetical protein [Alsobacter ponti]MCP8937298.1 hypothetical protein [Alsobacter ponti]